MSKATKDYQIKTLQKIFSQPGEKIANIIKTPFTLFNPLGTNDTNNEIEKKCIVQSQEHHNLLWIDVENPKRRELNELAEKYSIHPLHIDACLYKGQLDRVEKEEKYLFILLHIPLYHIDQDKIMTSKVCVFLGKNFLITIHADSPLLIGELFKECEENKEYQETFFKKSAGFLFYNVLQYCIKGSEDIRSILLQELDEIDDLVFDVKISGIYKISQLRQKIVRLRRLVGSYRKILQELVQDQSEFTTGMNRYYKNIANKVDRLWETLEEGRETIEIYKDADFTVSTEKTNKILTVLTVIFTLTIPATVIGSLFGMNVLIPGGIEDGSWTFFGPFTTFYIVISLSVLAMLVMLWYFKFRDWF